MLTVDFDLMEIHNKDYILDIGCGKGRHIWEACKRGIFKAYAVDIDREGLRNAKGMLEYMEEAGEVNGKWCVLEGNVMNLPFKDGFFDKIICSEMLEHVTDDHEGVKELYRVLKKGGIIAVSVPTYLTETIYWKMSKNYYGFPGGHIRKYKVKQLIELLEQHHFLTFSVRYKHALHSIYWFLRCLFGIKNENAFIPSLYHRFLAWDLDKKYLVVRRAENVCNRIFPKSLVIYARKEGYT